MTVVLYGATGYTGRLVTDELVRRGTDLVLGGRSRERLERVSRERTEGAPVRVATVDDADSLAALLEGVHVLVNCAGPFTQAGEPVVRAAVDAGVHYVDSTGEQGFIRMVFERYGERARRAGVALVPALGFDIVPGDCVARLAAEGLEPLEQVTVAYAVEGFGASRGPPGHPSTPCPGATSSTPTESCATRGCAPSASPLTSALPSGVRPWSAFPAARSSPYPATPTPAAPKC